MIQPGFRMEDLKVEREEKPVADDSCQNFLDYVLEREGFQEK